MAATSTRIRRVAVLGGNRIPFARANGPYAEASNQEMLTAALDGLVDRFGLRGERLGEVVAGAVLKHSRDFNLTREAGLRAPPAAERRAADGAVDGRARRPDRGRVGRLAGRAGRACPAVAPAAGGRL